MNDPRVPFDRDETLRQEDPPQHAPAEAAPDEAAEDDGYSATALGSHWFERPQPHPEPEAVTLVQGHAPEAVVADDAPEAVTVIDEDAPEAVTLVKGDPAEAVTLVEEDIREAVTVADDDASQAVALVKDAAPAGVAPDRVEGDVLRFGPGVTAAVIHRSQGNNTTAAVWHGTLAGQPESPPPPEERRRGGLRRYALAGTILLAVIAFLAWQRFGPSLAVRDVSVSTAARTLGCDSTADIVAVLRTNGRAGTVTYRWERSDGTTSGVLTEKLTRGQKQARLHLLWTFKGRGEYRASAELRILTPTRHTADTALTYRCS